VVHGDFVLSSGQRADKYVDLRRVTLDGRLAPLAGRVLLNATADLPYDAVGGLTLGADPVAAALAGELRHLADWLGLAEITVADKGDLARPLAKAIG